jgi:linearmycin/streptolysin S transport system ATP-binding protein
MIETNDLTKMYGELYALNRLNLTLQQGDVYGFIGPNGAGKTTTISMVAGLLAHDEGEVIIGGQPMTTHSTGLKASIGYVPQEIAIYPDLSARENLVFFARLYGMSGSDARARATEVLQTIGLSDRAGDQTKNYSGGMKRRLNIGVGLLHQPKLLILDEPTVGVDPQSRNAILQSVEELSSAGMAVLYTTHYMEEAERLCDRVGIIDRGQIIAEGTRRELVSLVGESDHVTLSASGDISQALSALRGLPWIRNADASDEGIELVVDDARAHLPAVLQEASAAGAAIKTVEVTEPDLEAVFLHLTGRGLRD